MASAGVGSGVAWSGAWGCREPGVVWGGSGVGRLQCGGVRGHGCCLGEVAAPRFHFTSVEWIVGVLLE